jgi:hypothetical protein
MRYIRTALVTIGSTAVVVAGLAVPATTAAPPPAPLGPPSTTVTDWAGIALSTVYPARSVPDGALYLGFTSLAVYDAVLTAKREHPRHGWVSARAAAAVAAHDVLAQYFPASAGTLDAALATSLGALPDVPSKPAGVAVGHTAAADMIASRVGDGRNNPAISYTKTPAIGVWRPTPPNNLPMALPWLGYVKPLLVPSLASVTVDGPDALTSAGYTADYKEVKTTGAATGSTRTADETTIAKFFNANVILQSQLGLLAMLDDEPLGVVATARLFALINASAADALITTWRHKLEVGFWRPITAIREGDNDTNTSTVGDPTWTPLIDTLGGTPPGTPPYPDYPSGHASGLNAFTEALTLTTGTTATDLTLFSSVTSSTRHYSDLATLSQDGFMARIWLGIHFRDAMEDARSIAVQTTRLVDSRLP